MSDKSFCPIIAITMGDPCGVGPEVIVKAFDSPAFSRGCSPVVIGDRLALDRAVALLRSPSVVSPVNNVEACHAVRPGTIPLLSDSNLTEADIVFGSPSPDACAVTVLCVETAVRLTMAGRIDAMCTCPINKEQLHRNGFPFPGHTEFIRDMTGSSEVVMMLAGPGLRVSLVTIHEALADVPRLLTPERIGNTIRITADAMVRDFGIKAPRIAVAALNPHAGEAGRFGREDIDITAPVIEEFRNCPWRVSGPWPADTLFHRAMRGEFDAVVAMYHDQGLIPVKLAYFDEAVNVSLGLPIIRTSVDHGTAYDIAGTGTAGPGSLVAAVRLAAVIAANRRRNRQVSRGVPDPSI